MTMNPSYYYNIIIKKYNCNYQLLATKLPHYPQDDDIVFWKDYNLASVLDLKTEDFRQLMINYGAIIESQPDSHPYSNAVIFNNESDVINALNYLESLILMMYLDDEDRTWSVKIGGIENVT